tara:strand:- start:543 stop:1073 length:531 start_codon:yes stop_codon:yes gene_type:complete
MAGFHTKTFEVYDDYMTPKHCWTNIKKYIPENKVIWEAFYGDGKSGEYLEELGFEVIHEDIDFFENNKGDIVVSNPPFAKIPEILIRLKELNKPFILIMPSSKINTQYFRKAFSATEDPIQIIIPRKRIQFLKMINGVVNENQKNRCNFDCFYYCWKMNLPRDIVWLNDDECSEMR